MAPGATQLVPDAAAFEWTCKELERSTSLDRLEARGTVRIALKQSGLDVRAVTPEQMKVVIEQVLPGELRARGVGDGDALCATLAQRILGQDLGLTRPDQSPDKIFERLGGDG